MSRYVDLSNPKIFHLGRDKYGNGIYHIPPDLPTDDVVERKKGKWIRKERNRGGFRLYTGIDELGETHTIQVDERTNGHDFYCSECGMLCSDVSLNFCSNCGSYNGGNEDE